MRAVIEHLFGTTWCAESLPVVRRSTAWKQLRRAASLREVCGQLGLRPGGGTCATLVRHVDRLGIDRTHMPTIVGRPRSGHAGRGRTMICGRSSRQLIDFGGDTQTWFQAERRNAPFCQMHIARLGLATDHFLGQSAWARGRPPKHGFRPRPLEEILVASSTFVTSSGQRRRLIAEGSKAPPANSGISVAGMVSCCA